MILVVVIVQPVLLSHGYDFNEEEEAKPQHYTGGIIDTRRLGSSASKVVALPPDCEPTP
jgi:hypothetical protein